MKLSVICCAGVALGVVVFAAEMKIKVTDLPAAVQSAVKHHAMGATILGASKEFDHGHMTYEVKTSVNGKGRDLTFAEDGSLQEVEQEMDLDSIPAPAKRAIEKAAGNGMVKKVESVTHGSATSYEADVKTKAGRNKEVAVNADGSAHKGD